MVRKAKVPTRRQNAGTGHSYFLDGERVPGVTTILGKGIPKPGLVGWAAGATADFVANRLELSPDGGSVNADRVVADALAWNGTRGYRSAKVSETDPLPRLALAEILKNIRYADLSQASAKGTEVHALAATIARGEDVEIPEAMAGHIESYERWLDDFKPSNAIVERYVFSRKRRFGGTLDMIADIEGHGTMLLDLKTSRSGIFPETALQVAAYGHADFMLAPDTTKEIPMPKIDSFGALWLRADGYDFYRFAVTQAENDGAYRAFLFAKAVGDWLDWKHGPAADIKSDSLRPTRTKEDSE